MVMPSFVVEALACSTDLQRTEKFQRFALQSVEHGIVITEQLGADNRMVWVNPVFERMSGYARQDLLGRDCRLLQGLDTDKAERQRLGQAIAHGESCTVTLKNYRQDGSPFWNEITVSPVSDSESSTRYFVGIQKDATEQHRLQERERQLGKILAESPDEIYTVGADDLRFLWANDSAISSLGYAMAELAEMTPMDIYRDLDRSQIMALMEPITCGQQEQVVFKTVNQRKDGSHYPVQVHLRQAVFDSKPGYVAVVVDLSQRQAGEDELRESYEDLRAMSGRLLSIRDEERRRLARELHDEIAQLLAAAQMDLTLLKGGLAACAPSITELLDSLHDIADRSVVSIRRLINDLRPKALEDAGLFGGIEMLAGEFGRRHELAVVLSVSGNGKLSGLPDKLVTPVYRLVQESLNNIAKHALATSARIELIRTDSTLTVRVRDDGIGLQPFVFPGQTGFGLTGMRERVALLGGDFTVSGSPGQGTEIVAVLPIPPM